MQVSFNKDQKKFQYVNKKIFLFTVFFQVIAILVSQTLYLTLVIEVIPATSITLPLLGR